MTSVKYDHASDKRAEEEYQAWQVEVLNEVWRVTKPGGSFFYNHKLRWEHGTLYHPYAWVSRSKWVLRQEIIWDRMIKERLRGGTAPGIAPLWRMRKSQPNQCFGMRKRTPLN